MAITRLDSSPRRWLREHARSVRGWIGLTVLLGWSGGLLLIGQAALLAYIIHAAFIDGLARTALLGTFGGVLGVIMLRAMLRWARDVVAFQTSRRVRKTVQRALLDHITALGPHYTRSQQAGALASSTLEQVEALHGYFADYLPQQLLAVLLPLSILLVVYPLNWVAGTIFLLTAPLIPLFMMLVGMGAEAVNQRQLQALARLSAYFLDVLQGLTTLKLLDRARAEADVMTEVSEDYRKRTMQVLRIAFLSSAVLEFFSAVAIALIAVYLGLSLLGRLDFGHYGQPLSLQTSLFILLLAPEFYAPLRQLGSHYHARAQALGAAEEMLKILTLPRPLLPAEPRQPVPDPSRISLQFEDVYLSYEQRSRPALAGVSFTVPAGQRVAVIGASGAGKTTLLNLVLGFLTPQQGRIRVNGVDLTALDPQDWRRRVAWLGQHALLLQGSIRDNIVLGRPDANPTQIDQAARKAQVWEFARDLPDGLDTVISERGLSLSGGQAQRVALARALLQDAPLVLLDEPTANLDTASEQRVINRLDELAQGRTVLLLTHRLSQVDNADQVLLLEQGRIVEQGSPTALIAARGRYYQLRQHYYGQIS